MYDRMSPDKLSKCLGIFWGFLFESIKESISGNEWRSRQQSCGLYDEESGI